MSESLMPRIAAEHRDRHRLSPSHPGKDHDRRRIIVMKPVARSSCPGPVTVTRDLSLGFKVTVPDRDPASRSRSPAVAALLRPGEEIEVEWRHAGDPMLLATIIRVMMFSSESVLRVTVLRPAGRRLRRRRPGPGTSGPVALPLQSRRPRHRNRVSRRDRVPGPV
jgi:hypothetical protein